MRVRERQKMTERKTKNDTENETQHPQTPFNGCEMNCKF